MPARAFNPQIFLEFVCYSVFGGFIFYLVRSGEYLSYVTPRMKPYLYFTAIVMLVWACVGLSRLFRPQYKIRSAHCFVLTILILFLLLPHSPLSTADLTANYTGGSAFSQGTLTNKQMPSNNPKGSPSSSTPAPTESNANTPVTAQPNDNISDSTDSTPPNTQSAATDDPEAGLSGLDAENKKITVDNDEFYPWIAEVYTNMAKYESYTISITGFVFKDPEYFAENEFVPARLAMTCCTADLAPLGMLCKYDKVSELKADSWVTVEGVIHKGQYEGEDEPQITVTKITPAQEVEGYIYPY
ncbi:TIGR03943 family putative permease subunit [Candidatus Formimonas warabiya]|nr:TIGR03943 family protein [Candidatus Formimonas warabiya]